MDTNETREQKDSVVIAPDTQEKEETSSTEFLLFELDKELYAVPVRDVDQVMKMPSVTSVPNTPDSILGVFHLRGKVIVVLDLLKRLRLERKSGLVPLYVFIAHHEKNMFAILVDHIRNVLNIPEDKIQKADPVFAARVPEKYLLGVFMYQEESTRSKRYTPDILIRRQGEGVSASDNEASLRPVLCLDVVQILNEEDILSTTNLTDKSF